MNAFLPCGPMSVTIRFFISSVALFVNVTAKIEEGGTPFSLTRYAMRWVITLVLPEPAPASIRSGPSVCVTAFFWFSLRSSRNFIFDMGSMVLCEEGGWQEQKVVGFAFFVLMLGTLICAPDRGRRFFATAPFRTSCAA